MEHIGRSCSKLVYLQLSIICFIRIRSISRDLFDPLIKYFFITGTQNGSMKAPDRWERHDALPGVMEGEAEDFLVRLEALHVSHFGVGAFF